MRNPKIILAKAFMPTFFGKKANNSIQCDQIFEQKEALINLKVLQNFNCCFLQMEVFKGSPKKSTNIWAKLSPITSKIAQIWSH